MTRFRLLVLLAILFGRWTAPLPAAPPIDFELVTERSFPLTGAQQWVAMFAKMGQTSLRIREGRPGDRELVENIGTPQQPSYRVVGVLTAGNRLILPGGKFGLNDRARLEAWIKKVQTEGETGPTKQTTVFGLTEEQLVAFHEKVSGEIASATRDRRAGDVAREIVKGTSLTVSVSDAARRAFQSDDTVADELQGLTRGTSLAAVLRPLGLVMLPELADGSVRMRICELREAREFWPVGWPPQDIPAKTAPKLFEYLKVTIPNRSLTEAMSAIQQRLEMPFLLDHNSLARKNIDPAQAKVSYTKDRSSYQKILDNLLFQAGLSSELRVDEVGHPFLWISTR